MRPETEILERRISLPREQRRWVQTKPNDALAKSKEDIL